MPTALQPPGCFSVPLHLPNGKHRLKRRRAPYFRAHKQTAKLSNCDAPSTRQDHRCTSRYTLLTHGCTYAQRRTHGGQETKPTVAPTTPSIRGRSTHFLLHINGPKHLNTQRQHTARKTNTLAPPPKRKSTIASHQHLQPWRHSKSRTSTLCTYVLTTQPQQYRVAL